MKSYNLPIICNDLVIDAILICVVWVEYHNTVDYKEKVFHHKYVFVKECLLCYLSDNIRTT